ncbi:MAG: hypothetical protein V3U02_02045 [Calditrichia bacterium]
MTDKFRNVAWGASQAQVLYSEELQANYKNNNTIQYSTSYFDKACDLIFCFEHSVLVSAYYQMSFNEDEDATHLQMYEYMSARLRDEYGSPSQDQKVWKDGSEFQMAQLNQEDPDKLIQEQVAAIRLGRLHYYQTWDLNDTILGLDLRGGHENICCLVSFFCKDANALHTDLDPDAVLSGQDNDEFFDKYSIYHHDLFEEGIFAKLSHLLGFIFVEAGQYTIMSEFRALIIQDILFLSILNDELNKDQHEFYYLELEAHHKQLNSGKYKDDYSSADDLLRLFEHVSHQDKVAARALVHKLTDESLEVVKSLPKNLVLDLEKCEFEAVRQNLKSVIKVHLDDQVYLFWENVALAKGMGLM